MILTLNLSRAPTPTNSKN
jgi:hypothetical protein